ncbi:MAG TPA: chromosome segregation protein SMC [Sedimentibacter sp.]|nr:chromosome segregation protein SMC [Sedimentibacter sp.]HOH69225.1 chromosome segregation protein SMC [Sedimentibacter sp.]
MYLKKIYVNGFKSFAEKTEIDVEKGITAVVGPNGSGKSNISDAIKWVLGEQSAKTLRGGKMDDIIFAGTEKRLPLGYAEVRLTFDNEDGTIPIEYKEVSISRKLYKTGESEYSINKQQCRLKDIRELFMDTGIGREGYSFIGQGRVEDILSPNSDVRRQVFEEASGIVKYKSRKEESEKKLEKTKNNLERAEDIIYELKERIEPLREQSTRALKFIEIQDNLKKYELNYLVHEYEKRSSQLNALKNQRDRSLEEKLKLQKRRDYYTEIIESQKEKINELQNKVNESEELRESKNKILENYNSLSQVHREKKLLYAQNIENVEGEIGLLEKRNRELKKNIDKLTQEKASSVEDLKRETEKLDGLNSDIKDYKKEIDEIILLIDLQKNELFEFHKDINKNNSGKNTISSLIINNNDRIKHLNQEVNSGKEERKNRSEEVNRLQEEQILTRDILAQKKAELKNIWEELNCAEKDKEDTNKQIAGLSEDFSSSRSKMNILSNMEAYYEGYYKSIKTVMNNKDKEPVLKAILGTVADIIWTEKKYEKAVEIALGSAIQNIIVNTESEAEEIIEYLKNNKIGRVTFLPINMLAQRSLNSSEREVLKEKCVIDTADNLVHTNPLYEAVIKNLLGRIIIVDNLNNGFIISRKLGNTVKIVTLQGDVINAGGSVTGGHIGANQALLGRKREIDELKTHIDRLSKELKEKNNSLDLLNIKIKGYKDSAEEIKSMINEKNNSYEMNNSKIKMLSEQNEKTSSALDKYIEEIDFIQKEKQKYENDLKALNDETEKLKSRIAEKEKSIETAIVQNDSKKLRYDEYNTVILSQRDKVAQINQNIKLLEEKLNSINTEIERNNEQKKYKEEGLAAIYSDIDAARDTIAEYTEKAETLREEINALNESYAKEKDRLKTYRDEIYDYQNKINESNKEITDILDDEMAMNVKIERESSKIEDISAKLWEDYEINYAMALKYKDDSISQTKLYSEVNSCKKAIKELGNINLDSIEEYKEVKERYDFLTKQQKDLTDAIDQLSEVIKELEIQMKDKFVEEFSNIREKFSQVFKKLFNGGSGDIYLENEEDALNSNIEITVQPPGKKLSKISLLSGGEKALTAIALLFSILKTKPTPFCVLDEIETSLDELNIFRFSQYLKEFSKETQFIVITHRKGTMEYADTLYGATMEEKGVTKLVSLRLSDAV